MEPCHGKFYHQSVCRIITRVTLILLGLTSAGFLIFGFIGSTGVNNDLGTILLPPAFTAFTTYDNYARDVGIYISDETTTFPAPYVSPPLMPWGSFMLTSLECTFRTVLLFDYLTILTPGQIKADQIPEESFIYTAQCGLFFAPEDFLELCPRPINNCTFSDVALPDTNVINTSTIITHSPSVSQSSRIFLNSFDYDYEGSSAVTVSGFCVGTDFYDGEGVPLTMTTELTGGLGYTITTAVLTLVFLVLGVFLC